MIKKEKAYRYFYIKARLYCLVKGYIYVDWYRGYIFGDLHVTYKEKDYTYKKVTCCKCKILKQEESTDLLSNTWLEKKLFC